MALPCMDCGAETDPEVNLCRCPPCYNRELNMVYCHWCSAEGDTYRITFHPSPPCGSVEKLMHRKEDELR